MSGAPTPDRRSRRRLRRLALLRPLLIAVVLVVVYYLWPANARRSTATLAPVVLIIAVLVGLLMWQVRAISMSRAPRLRAVEALATSIPLFVVLFAGFYANLSAYEPESFTEQLDRTDALYFTVTTLATVGFGDITAVTETARVAVTVQMVSGLVLLGVGVKVVLGAAESGVRRAGLPAGWLPMAGAGAPDVVGRPDVVDGPDDVAARDDAHPRQGEGGRADDGGAT
ncbi:potassium channel family protein [Georgenia soli]|nr:potassium channel family protein [Georgenia soli]